MCADTIERNKIARAIMTSLFVECPKCKQKEAIKDPNPLKMKFTITCSKCNNEYKAEVTKTILREFKP